MNDNTILRRGKSHVLNPITPQRHQGEIPQNTAVREGDTLSTSRNFDFQLDNSLKDNNVNRWPGDLQRKTDLPRNKISLKRLDEQISKSNSKQTEQERIEEIELKKFKFKSTNRNFQ